MLVYQRVPRKVFTSACQLLPLRRQEAWTSAALRLTFPGPVKAEHSCHKELPVRPQR